MKYDKPLFAGFLGAISTIPHELVTRILLYFGIGKYSVYNLSSLIVTINRPTAILGAAVTMIIGGSIAIVFYFSLKRIGSDYVVFKALGAALINWVIMEAVYVWLIEGPNRVIARPVSDYYLELIGTTVFGIVLGLLFKRFLIKETGHNYSVK